MKDITTVCSQDEVMAPDVPLQLTSPVHQYASYVGKPVVSPGAASVDSCYNTLSPASANSPSMSFALSPSASFFPSPVTSGGFIHSPSSFVPSPSAHFIPSPSPSTSFGTPPAPSFTTTSPPASFVPSPSTSFNTSGSSSSTVNSPFLGTVTVKTEPELLMSSLGSPPPQPPLMSPRSVGAKRSLSPPPSPGGSVTVKRERPSSPGRTVSGNLLPPCRICLDKASGFHYGLNTCEACKGFFRRSLKRGASYVCTRDGKCDVTGERRNLCGYCRYQKCISLGMSKTAIKTGRYTHAKRTRDTLEIKKMMRAETSVDEEEDIDCEGIISHVVYYHDKHVICSTKKPKTFIEEQLKKKMDELSLQKDLFGETGVSTDQHQEFLEVTGMELDNRETLMNVHVSNSDRWIRGFIEFAKHVPGFRDLTLADQARLIKYARIEFWFLGSFPGYHPELGLAVMPNGRCFTRREMYTVWKEKYIDVSFGLSQTLKKLKVTPDELILIKTICLTAEDRCQFDEPKRVAQLQWRFIRCLEHLLRQRLTKHSEFVTTFSQVFTCLTDLRDLNEAEYQTIQNTQLYEKFSKNDLIMEVLPY